MVDLLPDRTGHFEQFGGKFVPEALYAALAQLEDEFRAAIADPAFRSELAGLLADYTGRPSPITEARRFAEHAGGATILLKREDLNHTGSHKINNVLGPGPADPPDGQDSGSSPRPAPVSTGWPPPPRPPCSDSTARSTWARSTPSGRRSTWPGCGCWAPR